ncbi:MAG: aldehyde ferredoxin oxidoreductase C-terminal domain-containing protein [Peptococcaceae bacterium]|jgi:aldehyde:ferredoxin oxidoreductase|nr:aldehyde ferredoxin oxidoreductase [Peptococcaceae bacterium]MDH7526271.1 aldehyde ferredoxin oxidoreductase C-terminal domain-containing protein [Peptococcaceae bacterium]
MSRIVRINMSTKEITEAPGEKYRLYGGRSLIAKMMLDEVDPACEPLGIYNKLILAPGLLGGTAASSASRLSVGAKSPLTNGIKEANSGGLAANNLGKLGIKALVFEGLPKDDNTYVLFVKKDGVSLQVMNELKRLGTYDTIRRLNQALGKGTAVVCIGPAGESLMRSAFVACSDPNGEARFAARGGLGAVMGSKGIKAIVIENITGSQVVYKDKDAFNAAIKEYHESMLGDPKIKNVNQRMGTNAIFKAVNAMGALPTRNFREGCFEFVENLCGETMYETIQRRGGEGKTALACMNGCIIRCGNIYPDENGRKICSTLQYENVALLGSNLGMESLDSVARLNHACNDAGVDAIEMGATLGLAVEAGLARFNDEKALMQLIEEVRKATVVGRVLGNGAKVTGEVFGINRIPAAKGQAFPGYDPRGLKGNGVTYAMSPMGADHTAGNCFGARGEVPPLGTDRQGDLSRNTQIKITTLDGLGFCIFSRNYLFKDPVILATMVNSLVGAELSVEDIWNLGAETIKNEREFNIKAGLSPAQDRLPEFVTREQLPPHNSVFDLSEEEMLKGVV